MKEYYFLKGKDQNGPFSIEELKTQNLTSETLMWVEGMENWEKLKDLPDLIQQLKPKSTPPPPPNDLEEKITKTEVSGQLKITTEKSPNPAIEAIKPSKKALTWLIVWCSFHLFALLMSTSQIKFFNSDGKPETSKFWPFVDFRYDVVSEKGRHLFEYGSMPTDEYYDRNGGFYGIFHEYDWSEFAVYVGGALIIFFLYSISKNKNEIPKQA
jgi:hypothetical protein